MLFSIPATLTLVFTSLAGIGMSMRLLARRQFTMAYAMVWIGAFLGLIALVTVPPLLALVSGILHTENQEGAIRLLAMITVAGFLMFFSMKVSTLSNRLEELAQRVGLAEYALEKQIHPKPAERGGQLSAGRSEE